MEKIPCRKPCKECPWNSKGKHSDSWPSYVITMERHGYIENKQHACHMITSDTWGLHTKIDETNMCVGIKH